MIRDGALVRSMEFWYEKLKTCMSWMVNLLLTALIVLDVLDEVQEHVNWKQI